MHNQNYKTKVEYGVAAVVLLVGLFFIYQAMTITASKEAVGPRTMPLFLAAALALGGLWIALRAKLGKAGEPKAGYGFKESNVGRIAQVIGCGALFIVLFWAFGYFVAIAITFIAMMYAFGVDSWPKMLAAAILLAVIFQWLFMGVMRLNDPKGAIVNLRPYTSLISGE